MPIDSSFGFRKVPSGVAHDPVRLGDAAPFLSEF